ncbi:MAG: hypothetical protein RJQ21_15670 [Rhodospirillales bacterium]
MRFKAALLNLGDNEIVVVRVSQKTIDDIEAAKDAIRYYQPLFPGRKTIITAEDDYGRWIYLGNRAICEALDDFDIDDDDWQIYEVAD